MLQAPDSGAMTTSSETAGTSHDVLTYDVRTRLAELRAVRARVAAGPGDTTEKQHVKGRPTARERIGLLLVDDVIDPAETRSVLIRSLRMLAATHAELSLPQARQPAPVARFPLQRSKGGSKWRRSRSNAC